MTELALTRQLATTLGVTPPAQELATLFELQPEMVEWSINAGADPRGTLRVSAWTRERARAAAVLQKLAGDQARVREALLGDDHEGIGLAIRDGAPTSVRWWSLTYDGEKMVERARAQWPEHAAEIDALYTATGGPWTCTAVGIETGSHARQSVYARLDEPAIAVRVLELAKVPVSRASNLFFKGICGLEPGGRPWPRVWVARSFGSDPGWKFYYFARGDELRRTDPVLLAAIEAGPALQSAYELVRAASTGPVVRFIGLTIRGATPPSFTAYLTRF